MEVKLQPICCKKLDKDYTTNESLKLHSERVKTLRTVFLLFPTAFAGNFPVKSVACRDGLMRSADFS